MIKASYWSIVKLNDIIASFRANIHEHLKPQMNPLLEALIILKESWKIHDSFIISVFIV